MGKVLAAQVGGPKFKSPESMKKTGLISRVSVTLDVLRDGRQRWENPQQLKGQLVYTAERQQRKPVSNKVEGESQHQRLFSDHHT